MDNIQKLLSNLKNPSDDIRLKTIKNLENYNDYEVAENLIRLLSDYNPDIRTASAIALSKIGSERALPGLIKNLSDSNKDPRKAAAIALGKIGDYRAINHLRTLKRLDHNEDVREAADIALKEIDTALTSKLKKLAQDLGSPDIKNKRRTINSLVNIGTVDAACLLIKALGTLPGELQINILEALDKLKFLGIKPFVQGLKEENWKVRMACVEFLAQIKDSESLEPLIDILDIEENLEVKKSIASALGDMGFEDSLYHLRNMIRNSEPELMETAINSIAQIGGDQANEYLATILKEEEGPIITITEQHLVKLGYKIIPDLIEDYTKHNEKTRNAIKQVIKNIGDDAVDYFLGQISNPNPQHRKLAVEFLDELEAKKALEALTEMSRDDSVRGIRQAAAKAVKKIRKKYDINTGPSFIPSQSILHKLSTFFSDQIGKIGKVKRPSISIGKSDKLKCSRCGGIISRRASTVDLERKVEIKRFGICPLCNKIYCKGCATEIIIGGLTDIKCPNCNIELNKV